ncbi:MAG TPA: ABC transporter ATP-binding protein, partial [Oleiagrimonas sp.]|nr:ABC transporter ATP-binding protein [Oleiagrimonas sp.]
VANVHPRFQRARCEQFLEHTRIQPRQRIREMSKGMVVQLHLALVMAIDARLLEDYFDEDRTIVVTTHQVEEIEHILTDLLFIRDGSIVLDTSMDELEDRFAEVMVNPEHRDAARALGPLDERLVFGKSIFLFDGVDRERLETLGEIRRPSVSDLFVATMKDTYA